MRYLKNVVLLCNACFTLVIVILDLGCITKSYFMYVNICVCACVYVFCVAGYFWEYEGTV